VQARFSFKQVMLKRKKFVWSPGSFKVEIMYNVNEGLFTKGIGEKGVDWIKIIPSLCGIRLLRIDLLYSNI
jgi:hypothetical protein